ncbi:PilW family protein [Parahaliea sp. F7430]|uniref:PilW family protein n=1 Tax=Sediminihaliea albiluteola TaxID=2758564 RepID=A0A7W2TYN2_9GAMM|nr:PilW family protein [Sediminihaliea albiluteola]MBA6414311.1 PilW family protein [Sediminihaliea albiluteola]
MLELLVAMVLGLLLSAALIVVYLESKRNFLIEDEMARMQENGRFALSLLSRELSLANFFAGQHHIFSQLLPQTAPSCGAAKAWALSPVPALDLIKEGAAASLLTVNELALGCLGSVAKDIQPGTDILAIKRTATEPSLENGVLPAGLSGAKESQWYLRVADYGAELSWRYIAENENFPSADMAADSAVDYWEVYANIFFIRSYSNKGDAVPTLCTERLSANSMGPVECLVEGLQSLHLEFGVDSDGDGIANYYTASPSATELERSVIAKLYLLLRSLQPIAGYHNSKVYQLGQKTYPAFNDAYLRQVYSRSVQLRNSLALRQSWNDD